MARTNGKDRGLRPVTKPDGKVWWQARLYHHGQEWRSTPTPTKQEARDIYHAKKAEFREAEYFPQAYQAKQAQQVTIADLFELVIADYRREGRRTMSDALQMAGFWTRLAGKEKAASITGTRLLAWADEWIQAGYANATVNRRMEKLLRGYSLAKQADPPLLTTSPRWKKLQEAEPRAGWMEWATFEQVRTLLPAWDRVPVTMAYWTGMRSGEIKNIRWDQLKFYPLSRRIAFSLEGGQVKNRESRDIIWPGDLYDVLYRHREETLAAWPDCPWVCNRNGKRIGTYDTAWKTACVKLGLATGEWVKGRGFWKDYRGPLLHDFRRTAARNLIRAGVDRDIARKITGHKTDSVFRRYNIVSDEDLASAGSKVVEYVERLHGTGQKPDTLHEAGKQSA